MTRGNFIHFLLLALALTCLQSRAAAISDSDCLDCHGIETLSKTNTAGLEISLFVACLAIVVWHFYHVIFDPDIYPLNTACWNGRVSGEWQKHEHPLDKQAVLLATASLNSGQAEAVEKPARQQPSTSAGSSGAEK